MKLEGTGECAFIAYLMAGDPDPALTPVLAQVLARHADILELGIPFSDPIADGPTIQAASERALRAGMTPKRIFEHLVAIRAETNIPIVVMSYYNPIVRFGIARFVSRLAACGCDGLIIPDLPIEEADEVVRTARASGVDTIFLIAPTTPDDRIEQICAYSTGFAYLVSLLGVTGVRDRISGLVEGLIRRVIALRPDLPVAVGFGISRPEHVRELAACGARGVIVGSAIVDLIAAYRDEPDRMISTLDTFCADLKAATRR